MSFVIVEAVEALSPWVGLNLEFLRLRLKHRTGHLKHLSGDACPGNKQNSCYLPLLAVFSLRLKQKPWEGGAENSLCHTCDMGRVPCGSGLRASWGSVPGMDLGCQISPAHCPQRFGLSHGCCSRARGQRSGTQVRPSVPEEACEMV